MSLLKGTKVSQAGGEGSGSDLLFENIRRIGHMNFGLVLTTAKASAIGVA
jgi:hypothetical protein